VQPSAATTFLFTDIEGSTRLWEHQPEQMSSALAWHDAIARSAIEGHGGRVVKTTGDGVHAAFDDPLEAIAASLEFQHRLADSEASCGIALSARCGLHLGVAERRDKEFFGAPVNRAARLMATAHGGQVLLSQAVAGHIVDRLQDGITLRDLGMVRLRDLSTPEHVFQLVHPQLRTEFPPLRSLEAIPNNLPQQATNFIGRDKELQDLRRLLAKTRLLTLSGSGGCGKTRLCLQVAADSLEQFPDGLWLVELAPLTEPSLVPKTVATMLGLKEEANKATTQTLAEYLRDKRLLLLLDNCEHLLDGCARLSDALLRHAVHLKVLASSREALLISGEQVYRVPSLSLPGREQAHTPQTLSRYESVQLFTDRALLVRSDFQVTAENASALASVCCHLDGIPLAIELAAARVRSLSINEIDNKLDQRFRLLTGGSRTALPRQQTLRALIDWSYDLLGVTEQALFQRLSVFAGGWTLAAAEQVCSDETVDRETVLELLTSLVDKSLVLAEERDGATRYRLLETVRQYARETLTESGGEAHWRDRHLAYFLALTQGIEPLLKGPDVQLGLNQLETEHDNLRLALDWAESGRGDSVAGLQIAAALWWFWEMRGHLREGRRRLSGLLAAAPDTEALAIRAKALRGAGALARAQADYPAAEALHRESLAIRRELGDRGGIALALGSLGVVANERGNYDAARALQEESLAIQRDLGDRASVAMILNNLGEVAYHQGDHVIARARLEESLAIYRELGNPWGISLSMELLGKIASAEGDTEQALTLLRRSLLVRRELGNPSGIIWSLEGLAYVTVSFGVPERAARIWGSAEHLREEIGTPMSPAQRLHYDSHVASARVAMSDDSAFDSAWHEGRTMTLEQAIDYALNDPNL